MSRCKNCCKEFKYQWCLDRHLRRKTPCKKKVTNESSDVANTNDCVSNTNDCLSNMNDCVSNTNNEQLKCKYCNKCFGRKFELNKHIQNTCKEKDDYVRNLEIMLNIPYPNHIKHTQCRFCKFVYSEKGTLTKHDKKCKKNKNIKKV